MDTLPDRPTPADAPSGDGASDEGAPAPRPSNSAETVDMSQVAGDRPTALAAVASGAGALSEKAGKKKKAEAGATVPMAVAGPSEGAVSPADQALAELGTKRGIETLFRTNYRTNMDLTSLADAKANIMISINGLIVSILIASLAPGFEKNPWLLLATSLFLIGCLGSLIFAVLAARPRVQTNVVTVESAIRNHTNILFFGNFHHMTQAEYVFAMKQVVQDPTQIYEMMMKDVYGIGSVLQKKYELLRKSYTIFIVALVVGVFSFIATFMYTTYIQATPSTATYTVPVESLPPGAQLETRPGGILP